MAVVTPPAIPASTVAQANITNQTVQVVITGGTMTNVSINGVTAGAGAGLYYLPPGGTITMTYTVAPTWTWTTVVASPAMPASTVLVANNTGQNVDVAITGGTVSNVSVTLVGGTPTTVASSSPANVLLPPGASISITYSAAPTWSWQDPITLTGQPTYSSENLQLINQPAQLPLPSHPADGQPGLGEAVSN